MRVVFRADASLQIGSGHVMRCLTLADELRQRGADILFVCRVHPGHIIDLIEGKGYPVVGLPQAETVLTAALGDVAHAAWLGVSWKQDAADTIAAMGDIKADWLILDHYAIDSRWENKLRFHVGNMMVIDDLADRPHDCDLLLDQNLYENMDTRYSDLISDACTKLIGPHYALLRPEFSEARNTLQKRNGIVGRILVFFGSSDTSNETAKALKAIELLDRPEIAVDVVVGKSNPHKSEIETLCRRLSGVFYHCQVDNMAVLLATADLAIGAGGSATWERCALGVPSLVEAVAVNQLELSETGARHGLFFHLGEATGVSSERLLNTLKIFLDSPENLQYFAANGLAMVDAKGCKRVAGFIFPPRITLRPAVIEDCDAMHAWRNAEETRRYIFGAGPIPLETHRDWFYNSLENDNRILLVGEIDKQPVGVLRYDISEDEALISVYLVPGVQGRGVGSQLIHCGSQWIRENHSYIKFISAEIFRENVASLRAFELAGYKEHHVIFKEVL